MIVKTGRLAQRSTACSIRACPAGVSPRRTSGCVAKSMQHTVAKARFNRSGRAAKLVLRADAASGASAPPPVASAKKETTSAPIFIAGACDVAAVTHTHSWSHLRQPPDYFRHRGQWSARYSRPEATDWYWLQSCRW